MVEALIAVVAALFGVGATTVYNQRKGTTAAQAADKLIASAKNKASDIVLKAKDEALKLADDARKEEEERRKEIKKAENRVADREINLDLSLIHI